MNPEKIERIIKREAWRQVARHNQRILGEIWFGVFLLVYVISIVATGDFFPVFFPNYILWMGIIPLLPLLISIKILKFYSHRFSKRHPELLEKVRERRAEIQKTRGGWAIPI